MKRLVISLCEVTDMVVCVELEWMLAETGAIETQLEQRPRQSVDDVMMSSVRRATVNCADDADSDD